MYEKVVEFNKKILGVEERQVNILTDSELAHLIKCIKEEINEFKDAHSERDVVLCVDSILDLCYFALGSLHRMGVKVEDFEEIFDAVHSANMSKVKGVVEKRNIEGVEDAVKPESWVAPEVKISEILWRAR